jgi:hypothetical protein
MNLIASPLPALSRIAAAQVLMVYSNPARAR